MPWLRGDGRPKEMEYECFKKKGRKVNADSEGLCASEREKSKVVGDKFLVNRQLINFCTFGSHKFLNNRLSDLTWWCSPHPFTSGAEKTGQLPEGLNPLLAPNCLNQTPNDW